MWLFVQAGLPEENLKICLESEAASVFCQNMPSNIMSDKLPIFKAGTKYVLADLGGKDFYDIANRLVTYFVIQ